jgi:hypothetical protein
MRAGNPKDWKSVDGDMAGEFILRMRGRVKQLRKVESLAHDPRIIEVVRRVIDEIEADIKKLEAEEPVMRIPGANN